MDSLLPASMGGIFRLVKVVLPQAFWAWAGAAHISDKKAHKWPNFNLWANKCGMHTDIHFEKSKGLTSFRLRKVLSVP